MQFTDEEKMSLTIDILNITHGQSIALLLATVTV